MAWCAARSKVHTLSRYGLISVVVPAGVGTLIIQGQTGSPTDENQLPPKRQVALRYAARSAIGRSNHTTQTYTNTIMPKNNAAAADKFINDILLALVGVITVTTLLAALSNAQFHVVHSGGPVGSGIAHNGQMTGVSTAGVHFTTPHPTAVVRCCTGSTLANAPNMIILDGTGRSLTSSCRMCKVGVLPLAQGDDTAVS